MHIVTLYSVCLRKRFLNVSYEGGGVVYATVFPLRLFLRCLYPAHIQSCLTVLTVERTSLTALQ